MAKHHERIIRISRRVNLPLWQKILIKASFILFALLVCGLLSNAIVPGSFAQFYVEMINGTLMTQKIFLTLLWETAILFLVALALTPAFKMKFWNIGGEGQILMGGLGTLIGLYFIAPHVPLFVALLIELILGILFAVIWAFIPAFFKAVFNTNETLFTLMLNYVAMGIVSACCLMWANSGSGTINPLNTQTKDGWVPIIQQFNNSYIINIIIIAFVAFLVWVYLRYSKHGYELNVVGGSRNTAKYVGINVKAVIIRTVILSGAICGLAGFLLVAGASHTMNNSTAGGRGFSAIMVSWIGDFSVPVMALYSFLISFISKGSASAAKNIGFQASISNVLVAVFFILIISSNFFVNFKVHIKLPFLRKEKPTELNIEEGK